MSGIPGTESPESTESTESPASQHGGTRGGEKALHRRLLHTQHIPAASHCRWGGRGSKVGMAQRGNRSVTEQGSSGTTAWRGKEQPVEGAWDQV